MQTLVMSCLVCATHAHIHGEHPLVILVHSKNLTWLACTQTKPTLEKITTSHIEALDTQLANKNMPKRVLIA